MWPGFEILVTAAWLENPQGVQLLGTRVHVVTEDRPQMGAGRIGESPEAWAIGTDLIGQPVTTSDYLGVTALVARTSAEPGSYDALVISYMSGGRQYIDRAATSVELKDACF